LLFIVGLAALAYYGYSLSDQYVYQAYQNWSFDQQIAGRSHVTFADFVRERTPFGFLVGSNTAAPATTPAVAEAVSVAHPAQGALIGRVEVPRLNLSAIVREGVDAKTLSLAVGHVPSTSLPGQTGNFAIAAHRDTLFRALKDIRQGDVVTFQAPTGTYRYEVAATKIVKPSNIEVLRSDGGGLIPGSSSPYRGAEPNKLLTMITCYPFYYVGSAPKRFIVEAKLIQSDPLTKFSTENGASGGTSPPPAKAHKNRKVRLSAEASAIKPRSERGFSHSAAAGPGARRQARTNTARNFPASSAKKHGFWQQICHI
jgi:sortase A